MSAHGSEWYEGYDAAVREYEAIITNYESGYRWAPVLLVLMFVLGVVTGLAVAR
jgi:hypothetical protein